MKSIIDQVYLYNNKYDPHQIFNIFIYSNAKPDEDGKPTYEVVREWGALNSVLKRGIWSQTATLSVARKTFDRLAGDKLVHGYKLADCPGAKSTFTGSPIKHKHKPKLEPEDPNLSGMPERRLDFDL
jgi:hypothetical protein